jgi:predicted nucleotidyltransferase
MSNNDKILQVIQDVVMEKYHDDVSLVCCYGSYVNGTANEKSDIDFYFVPKTDRAWELSTTFILDEIGYDFWGIDWSRLEKMSMFEDMFVSLVAGAKVVFRHSEEDEERFISLKRKIENRVSSSVIESDMLFKAMNHIKESEHNYFLLISNEGKKSKLQNAGEILLKVSDAVCLMNNSFLRYGTKRHFEEIISLKHLPNNFKENYYGIILARDESSLTASCFNLIQSAIKLHDYLQGKVYQPQDPSVFLSGIYEEKSSSFTKIYQNCDSNNPEQAFINGVFLQGDMDYFFAECGIEQIDFISCYDSKDLEGFKGAVANAEEMFLSSLKEYKVSLKRYNSVLDMEKDLRSN